MIPAEYSEALPADQFVSYRHFIKSASASPVIVAHRGAWRGSTENSLEAIANAARAGHEIAEVDVRRSADGILHLFHDADLKRMAGRPEAIETLDADALSAVHLYHQDGEGAVVGDQCIPTFAAALEMARGQLYLDIDVKDPVLIDETAAAVVAAGMADQVNIKMPVSTYEDVEHLRALEARYGILTMPMIRLEAHSVETQLALLRWNDVEVVEISFDRIATLQATRQVRQEIGMTVWINTLDVAASDGLTDSRALAQPDAVWGLLLSAGAGVIQTDYPDELAAWRRARQSPS